ncbi:MAG: DUF3105 domain-containing protein [Egibacteraceae bacterium]
MQLSERERQKAHRNRILVFAAVVVLVLAGVGLTVQRQQAATAALGSAEAAVAAKLEQFNCTQDTEQPDLGGGHVDELGPAAVAANPPEKLYSDRPASSGRHVSPVVVSGVYDTLIDERPLVHDLEHGWVNIYYLQTAPADQVERLKSWARVQIDGPYPKMIVAPWIGGKLLRGANFAYVAWHFRQLCGQFDPQVAEVFAKAHSGSNSKALEAPRVPADLPADNRRIFNPSNANLLFPPLDQQLGQGQPNLAAEAPPLGQ